MYSEVRHLSTKFDARREDAARINEEDNRETEGVAKEKQREKYLKSLACQLSEVLIFGDAEVDVRGHLLHKLKSLEEILVIWM